MDNSDVAVNPNVKYDGFYETTIKYNGQRVFQSKINEKSYHRETKPGVLEIMTNGEIKEMSD
ncbi:hypothetical protein HYU07_04270 [Candidatus Woesearchaeota archaeon]|nr:hypothetical protein [Candidatus Woesearchaeota archaeon]